MALKLHEKVRNFFSFSAWVYANGKKVGNRWCKDLDSTREKGFAETQKKKLDFRMPLECFRTGVANSFVSAGHVRDKLGIQGPVHLLLD